MKIKNKAFLITVVVIALLLIFTAFQSFYIVEPDQHANKVRFSKTVSTVSEPGLYFKIPFVDEIKYFPKEVLLYDMKPTDVLTKDKQSMQVDNYVIWRITDPLTFYKTLDNIENAESRIDALTYSAIQTEMGGMERDKIIKQDDVESRDSLNIKVIEATSAAAETYGIEIIDVKIKKLDLPEDNEQAVYNRMIAERNEMAAKERAEGETEASKIKNQIDKETGILISEAQKNAEITKAEGEKEYMKILAEAYNDESKKAFYEFIRSLEALEISLTGETTIILDENSVIAKALLAP